MLHPWHTNTQTFRPYRRVVNTCRRYIRVHAQHMCHAQRGARGTNVAVTERLGHMWVIVSYTVCVRLCACHATGGSDKRFSTLVWSPSWLLLPVTSCFTVHRILCYYVGPGLETSLEKQIRLRAGCDGSRGIWAFALSLEMETLIHTQTV